MTVQLQEATVPEVRSETVISADPARVYSLAKEVERLPAFLPNLEKVTVLSREGNRTTSEWVGLVPEFKRTIRWVEEDVWEDDHLRCAFRAISGDWDEYRGVYSFSGEGNETRVCLVITYEYNVPLIGPLIKKLLHKLVVRNADETLQGLRRMVEEAS
jgi:ribosome-associated toxin RatA of RatAB toxin-antitoxin module